MTDRSTFPDGVPVHDVDLQNESTQVSTQLRRRLMDHAQPGLVSGGVISLNGTTPSRIDVTALVAYAPGGEMIEIGAQTSLAMADYTLGAVNYVVAVYTETQGTPQAHQTDGTTRNTRASRSGRLVVMSQAQYSAMPATSTDLGVNAVDRAAPIGIVLANGFTGATPNSLIAGDVIQDTAWSSFVYPNYPSPTTLTGINIASIDQATVAGTGSLAFTAAGTTATWTAPGGTAGVAVNIGAGGQFTLTSGTIARTVTINVIAELLPLVNATVSIVINIGYTPSFGPRFSLRDMAHRSTVGSVAPTYTNPHGQVPADWGAQAVDIPMQVRFGDNYLGSDLHASYPRTTARMRSGVRTLFSQYQINRTNNIWARVYANPVVDGEMWTTFNARWNQATTQWVPDYASANSYAFISGPGHMQMRFATTAGAAFAEANWLTNTDWGTTGYAQQLGSGMLTGSSDSIVPRLSVPFRPSGQEKTTVLQSTSSASATVGAVNIYRSSSGENSATYVTQICCNASFNNSTVQWHQVDSSTQSTMLEISADGNVRSYLKAGGSADWAVNGWNNLFHANISGQVYAGTEFRWFTSPTHIKRIPGFRGIGQMVLGSGWTGGTVINGPASGTNASPLANGGEYVLTTDATHDTGALWAVELPDGAVVTRVQMTHRTSTVLTGSGARIMMYRQAYDNYTLGTLLSTGPVTASTSTGAQTTTLTPDQNNTIDNTNYSYFLHCFVGQSATNDVRVMSWEIRYTMTTLRSA